jgi:hypothetical protein
MKFAFVCRVEECVGIVAFEVDGATEAEARANLDAGKGRMVFDQVEIKKLSRPECLGIATGKVKAGNA